MIKNLNGVQGVGSSNLLIPTNQYQGFPVNSRNPFFINFLSSPPLVHPFILTEDLKKLLVGEGKAIKKTPLRVRDAHRGALGVPPGAFRPGCQACRC